MTTGTGADVIRIGAIEIRFRLDATDTAGSFTLFELLVPSQARVPVPHLHEAFDEAVYGLEGITSWTVDSRRVELGPGDVLFIRRGSLHGFENSGTAAARSLNLITPGVLGPAYFQEIAQVVNAGGPPDMERLHAVMQRHGLRPTQPGTAART